MRCPACVSEPLITVEYGEIEVDYCDTCRGVWLDTGEIEAIVGDPEAAGRILSMGAPIESPERRVRCPECGARMLKGRTGTTPPVTYDHCPAGDGVWFDHRELEIVLSHAESLGAGGPIATYLQGLFAPRGMAE
jgi:uncharacterized protein